MFGFIMTCTIAGAIYGILEIIFSKNNPEEDYEEDFGRNTKGFDRGYYRQRRGMFDNFR